MKHLRYVLAASLFLWSTPVRAQDSPAQNGIGFGWGDTVGAGFHYRRTLMDGWHGRLSAFAWPGQPAGLSFASLGASILRDLGPFAGGRSYLLGAGVYQQPSPYETLFSLTPGAGVQWGHFFLEAGVSYFSSVRQGAAPSWGYLGVLGLGLIWEY